MCDNDGSGLKTQDKLLKLYSGVKFESDDAGEDETDLLFCDWSFCRKYSWDYSSLSLWLS